MKLADLTILNMTSFLKSQAYLQPVMFLFYMQNGLTMADYFFFQGIVCFAELILGLPCGWLADRFQKKYMMILAYSMLLLRYTLWFCFQGYWIILIGELCYAFYKSLFQSSADGYIYQYLCDHKIEAKNLHNYGKFNFATSMGSAVAALLGAILFKKIGIDIVLIVQITIIALSVLMLFMIVPVSCAVPTKNQKHRLFSFFFLAQKFKGSDMTYYILLSALLTSVTNLFLHTFQPLMTLGGVPVVLYGCIYFFNHTTRAASSFYTPKLIHYIGLNRLSLCVGTIFASSFVMIFSGLQLTMNAYIVVAFLLFICIGIAGQLCFSIGVTSYLQEHTDIDNRSMMASIHNTSIRLFSSIFLLINTKLVKQGGLQSEMIFGIGITMLCLFLVWWLQRMNKLNHAGNS